MYGVNYAEIKKTGIIYKVELKQKYLALIKKYHSDNCQHDQNMMKVYEEITKIIIKTYNQLEGVAVDVKKETFHQENMVEDKVCMELFGKKYNEVKYWIHEKGNEKEKQAFFQRLYQQTGNANYKQKQASASTIASEGRAINKGTTESVVKQDKMNVYGVASLGLALMTGLLWFFVMKKQQKAPSPEVQKKWDDDYGAKNIEKIWQKESQKKLKKANEMITLIVEDHPPSLKYPSKDPHIMKQLTQFSIGSDIHLYEVSPIVFYEEKDRVIANGLNMKYTFPITRIKPNTAMTLSLEAERALHNIYVKVGDVIKEIKTKGKYTPPQVFIKFHGYIMVEIREKPMTLTTYRNTNYISLFELYFDYYSPIYLKHDNFSHYLVGKDEKEYFGWVHLNRNQCPPVYLKSGQKAAFFISSRSDQMIKWEKQIWKHYYECYQDRWKEGGNTRDRVGV